MNSNLRVLFCNIGYMKYYNGAMENDSIQYGGEYVQSHNKGGEMINFDEEIDPNLYYGFVETKHRDGYDEFHKAIPNNLHIENIDYAYQGKEEIENVLVVFCAKSPIHNKTVIVSWYEHATAFRKRQYVSGARINGYGYHFVVKKKDAYLIPHEQRHFFVKRARPDGIGFGQSNVWYPFKHIDKPGTVEYIKEVLDYLENCKKSITKP